MLDDAEVLLSHAIQFEPDNRLARFDYMTVLYKRQKYQAAFDQAEFLLSLDPDNVQYQTAYAINVLPSVNLMKPSKSTIV